MPVLFSLSEIGINIKIIWSNVRIINFTLKSASFAQNAIILTVSEILIATSM